MQIFQFLNSAIAVIVNHLQIVSNLFTIIGVILAIKVYFSWSRDYRMKLGHEYAIDLLTKMKKLHLKILNMRRPRPFSKCDEGMPNYLEETIIQAMDSVQSDALKISNDLLICNEMLGQNIEIQDKFNNNILQFIIKEIRGAVFEYMFRDKKNDADINKFKIWKVIFPYEDVPSNEQTSILGGGIRIIDDDLNRRIEENFSEIYEILQGNLTK